MKIDHLLQVIGTSVQEAHKAIEYYSVNYFFENYFDKTEGGEGSVAYTPKLVEIHIPSSGSGSSKVVYAPVAGLVQHRNLNIDYIKLNLNIDVTEESDGSLQVSAQGFQSQKDDSNSAHAGMLEISLKCSDTSEGIARIETLLDGMI